MDANKNCPKCNGTGRVKKADGTISICFDCLQNGSMDQHEKKIRDAKDFGIRL
jgi:DnaJ-class molecular chaperone